MRSGRGMIFRRNDNFIFHPKREIPSSLFPKKVLLYTVTISFKKYFHFFQETQNVIKYNLELLSLN